VQGRKSHALLVTSPSDKGASRKAELSPRKVIGMIIAIIQLLFNFISSTTIL
jgi:hypothetical protein